MAHILLISLAYLEQKKESREIKSFCQISFLPSAAYAQFSEASGATVKYFGMFTLASFYILLKTGSKPTKAVKV